jgi:hypothetical protein
MSYAENVRPRLRLPATAARGEVIEVRTLISTRWKAAFGSTPAASRCPG